MFSKGRACVRTKSSFSLLHSTHMCIRGSRTKRQHAVDTLGWVLGRQTSKLPCWSPELNTDSGKKNEVVLIGEVSANLASNNARQIYAQVVGLNIYDSNDAGLQLNIGGRGLDPNRTSNFNTRQNGYDISADVLGYPESYYTPPAEALKEIQVIRGAAALQYGTQFGGLVNFVMNKPSKKSLEV